VTTSPLLDELLLPYFTAADLGALDATLVLDASLRGFRERGADLELLASHLERLASGVVTDDDARAALPATVRDLPLPDGPDHLALLRSVARRVREAADGAPLLPAARPGDGMVLPRASRFASEELANEACTLLVRRNYDMLKQFEAGALGWGAVHLYDDLGHETGNLGSVVVNPRPSGTTLAVTPGETRETSCAVMVMRRDPATGAPYIDTAYPELPLSTGTREAFPALCHFFGSWFAQDREQPVTSMREAFLATTGQALEELRNDLDRLLERQGDGELRLVLEACGSYVLPEAVRPWLEATRRRVDAFDRS
jgi:hypothetical protein